VRPSLIVFIDCLPFSYVSDGFLPGLPGRASVRPGFGYSVNLVAELFAGLTPDQLGFLNVFNYSPGNRWLRGWAPALRLLSPLRHAYYADRVAHKALSRVAGHMANIPFSYLGHFEPTGSYPFSPGFPHPTLLNDPAFRGTRVLHAGLRGAAPPHRDRVLLDRALAAVRPGEGLFVSLPDLDALVHATGVGSPEFMGRIADYHAWLGELIGRFRQANPDGYVAVVSDHGAANVRAPYDMRVERHFGRARPGRYMYFLDATLARFWVPDAGLRAEIAAHLREERHGVLVDEEERREYGVTSRALGDLLWVVDEGLGISPSFLGRGTGKALHGYHPALPSQQAVFLASEPLARPAYRTTAVHGELVRATRGAEAAR
jgi:hypothetical protein